MFTAHIDLGQVIISILIGTVGWFVKRTIDRMDRRLDKHEDVIFNMNGSIQRIAGVMGIKQQEEVWKFNERRSAPREN